MSRPDHDDCMRLIDVLMWYTGDKRVLMHEFARLVGVSDRQLRIMVNFLRQQGVPVASDSRGYFWARTPDEMTETLEHIGGRMRSLRRVYDGLVATQQRMLYCRKEAGPARSRPHKNQLELI